MAELPNLSEMAWRILDAACAVSLVNWDRCAPGPRDALEGFGLVVKGVQTPAVPKKMGRGGRPAVHKVQPTDKGHAMLAAWKASR